MSLSLPFEQSQRLTIIQHLPIPLIDQGHIQYWYLVGIYEKINILIFFMAM